MSPFFDQLEDQLRSAARARAGGHEAPPPRRRGSGWLHAGLRAVPVLAALLVALVVVGGALVLLRHHGHGTSSPSGAPPTGPGLASIVTHTPQRQLHSELSYIAAATHSTLDSRVCRVRQPTGVSMIHGAPGTALVSSLGVLRRPATAADRLDPAVLAGTPDVYAGHTRRALTADGVSYYIVPARYDRSASVPSDRCFALQLAALHRALPKIPSALRHQTRVLQAGLIAYARRQAARAPRDTICLVTMSGRSSGAQCGISAAAIKRGVPVSDELDTFFGIAPDGVASVTLGFAATRKRPARSLTAPVINNVYAARVPWAGPAPAMPAVIWRSAQGRVLKRIPVPKPQTAADFCRRRPVACLLAQTATLQRSSSGRGALGAKSASASTTTSSATTSGP